MLTVEPALFLISMGYGIPATASKVLFYDKVCIMLLDDIDVCVSRNFTSEDQETAVQQEVSIWEFYQIVVACLPAIFMNVVYANLCDRWSKKYTMLFCPIGYILSLIVYMVGAIYLDSSPAFMLIAPLVIGIAGGMLTMLGASFSYLSATTNNSNLIIHISLAEAALLASSSMSSFISGILYDTIGYFYVYLIGIIINVLLIIYILLRLKNIPPLKPDKESKVPGNIPTPGQIDSNVPGLENVDKMPGHQTVEVAAVNIFRNNTLEGEGNHEAATDKHPTETDSIPDAHGGSTHPMCDPEVPNSRGVCLSFRRTVKTLGMFAKAYFNTVARRREQNKRSVIIAILSIICVEMMCVFATGWFKDHSLCFVHFCIGRIIGRMTLLLNNAKPDFTVLLSSRTKLQARMMSWSFSSA